MVKSWEHGNLVALHEVVAFLDGDVPVVLSIGTNAYWTSDIVNILETIKEFNKTRKNCVFYVALEGMDYAALYCLHQEVVWKVWLTRWWLYPLWISLQYLICFCGCIRISLWIWKYISGNSHCYSYSCNANDVGKWSSATESFVLALVTTRLQLMLKWQSSWEKCPPSYRDLLLLLIVGNRDGHGDRVYDWYWESTLVCMGVCSFGVASVKEYSLAAEEGKLTTNGQRGYMKE